MPDASPHPDSNGAGLASEPEWTRLVAEWFEEQAALVVAELERPGGAPGEVPEAARADRGR